jgi:hypothetical protein
MVHIHQLVVVAQFTIEQRVHLLNDFREVRLFLLLQLAAAWIGLRWQRFACA